MSRTVTAIFRTAGIADHVASKIESLGVSSGSVHTVGGADRASEIASLNLPHDEAVTYRQAVRQGHYIVSADVEEAHVNEVAEIMRHPEGGVADDAVDIDAYETDYRASDTYAADLTEYEAESTAYNTSTPAAEGEAIDVAEERLVVGKRDVNHGTTHVRTYVQEVPVEERVRLRQERVDVTRRAGDGRVVTGDAADALFQDRDIAVTERAEEAVVGKEAVVTEQVVVSKDVDTTEEVVRDTVRKTEVEIDKDRT